jgi:hypothetical protein
MMRKRGVESWEGWRVRDKFNFYYIFRTLFLKIKHKTAWKY